MSRVKCEHNRRRQACKDCGGRSICEHNRQRPTCKECKALGTGGGSICEHGRIRSHCKDCKALGIGGSQICDHKTRRQQCKKCGGSSICKHSRQRSICRECEGSTFCKHNRLCHSCSICKPEGSFKRYNINAIRRGYSFTIILDDFQWITTPPCIYCGESEEPRGIDRWDNSIGYEFDNCRPCCGTCNHMKGKIDGETFITRCIRVAKQHISQREGAVAA